MKHITFLDLETTSLYATQAAADAAAAAGKPDAIKGSIISIAIITSDGKQHSCKVKPTTPVTPGAASINGYSEESWADAQDFDTIAPFIIKYLQDTRVVGHNVKFDLDFLHAQLEDHGYTGYDNRIPYDHIDTVSLARAAFPTLVNHRLETVANALNIHFKAHDALADIVATKEVFDILSSRISRTPVIVEKPSSDIPGFNSFVSQMAKACAELA